MQERYSVSSKGKELGPFSKDEILQKVKANELSALDFVFDETKNDWVPLLEFMPVATSLRPPETKPQATAAPPRMTPPPTVQPPAKSPPKQQGAPVVAAFTPPPTATPPTVTPPIAAPPAKSPPALAPTLQAVPNTMSSQGEVTVKAQVAPVPEAKKEPSR